MTTPRPEEIPDVADGESLIRHLDPRYHWDAKEKRPHLGAFKSREVSVDREAMREVEVARSLRPIEFGFARLSAGVPRALGLSVHKDPIVPDEPLLIEPEPSLEYNPAHALIFDATRARDAKVMRDSAEIVHPCDGVPAIEMPRAVADPNRLLPPSSTPGPER